MEQQNIYEKILSKTELKSVKENERISGIILEEIQSYMNEHFSFKETIDTNSQKLFELKYQRLYHSTYLQVLFMLLDKYHYDRRKEIKDAMIYLSHLKDLNKNQDMIKRFLASPVIQDISFNGKNTFEIISDEFGVFPFIVASSKLRKHKKINEYIEKGATRRNCHTNTLFLSTVLPEDYAITSLCPLEFGGFYHHSYTYNPKSDQIIDLARNTIMTQKDYNRLLQPEEVSVIPNDKVLSEALITKEKAGQSNWCTIIKIALYKEYLTSIGYNGDLEKAPYVKQR